MLINQETTFRNAESLSVCANRHALPFTPPNFYHYYQALHTRSMKRRLNLHAIVALLFGTIQWLDATSQKVSHFVFSSFSALFQNVRTYSSRYIEQVQHARPRYVQHSQFLILYILLLLPMATTFPSDGCFHTDPVLCLVLWPSFSTKRRSFTLSVYEQARLERARSQSVTVSTVHIYIEQNHTHKIRTKSCDL